MTPSLPVWTAIFTRSDHITLTLGSTEQHGAICPTGIDALCAEAFDLVLTDICMPGISGNILAGYVHNLRVDIPVIAVTASPWLANELFDMVIEKPFELTFLLDTIAYYLPTEADLPDEYALQLCI